MKPKLDLETTIPSHLAARPSRDLLVAAHQQLTRDWWDSRRSAFELCVSELVVEEARAGDAVRDFVTTNASGNRTMQVGLRRCSEPG